MRTSSVVLSSVAAAALLVSAPAFANEGFGGIYAGGQIGYDSYGIDLDDGVDSASLNADGIEGGIFVGYNWLFDHFVVGVEGQAAMSDADTTISTEDLDFTLKAKETYGISARVGTLISDNALVYVLGGWVNTRFKADAAGLLSSDESERLNGWRAGVGIEAKVSENVSVRAEYSYADYEVSGDVVEPKNSSFQFGIGWYF